MKAAADAWISDMHLFVAVAKARSFTRAAHHLGVPHSTLSRRVAGIAADSKAQIDPWPLGEIRAPVLIVSAEDDLFRTLPGARYTAERIPGCELRILPSGGHLMVGQNAQVQRWVGDFLSGSSASKLQARDLAAA